MKERFSRRSVLAVGAIAGASICSSVLARPQAGNTPLLKIMVPFPGGGMADFIGRLLADKLKEELGRVVIVDNRPGAGMRLAAEVLKNSAPDGNTVLLSPIDPITVAPLIYDNIRYTTKDFLPVTDVVQYPFGIAVKSSSPYKTLDQIAAASRQDPKQGAMGITATGTGLHFLAQEVLRKTKIDGTIVPYRGGAAMVVDILGGTLPAGMDSVVTMIEHHRAGKLRVLAVSGAERSANLPDVPTLTEVGYPDLKLTGRYMVFAPSATPTAEINRLNQALRKVLAMPDVRQKISTAGFDLVSGASPGEANGLIEENIARWGPVIKESGFKGE